MIRAEERLTAVAAIEEVAEAPWICRLVLLSIERVSYTYDKPMEYDWDQVHRWSSPHVRIRVSILKTCS
jgi:hypothetical protein